jgi:biopolymer transport protein ExbD
MYRLFYIFLVLIFAGWLACSKAPQVEQSIIIVKVPLVPDKTLSQEEIYWRSQKLLFPQIEIPNPIPEGLPNDDSLFLVSLEKDGKIKLNSEVIGSLDNPEILRQTLKQIFQQRTENGVFEPNSNKIAKAVAIKAPLSMKYGDFLKIAEAVKESGAEPIVLQVDELPD